MTPFLVASLARAGVIEPYKIPDPQAVTGVNNRTGQSFRRIASGARPCDIIGVLNGGRAFRCEAKREIRTHAGNLPTLKASAFKSHQLDHLAAIVKAKGCAVVAVFLVGAVKRDTVLYWIPYQRIQATLEAGGSVDLRPLVALPPQFGGKSGRKFIGWNLRPHIMRAAGKVKS